MCRWDGLLFELQVVEQVRDHGRERLGNAPGDLEPLFDAQVVRVIEPRPSGSEG